MFGFGPFKLLTAVCSGREGEGTASRGAHSHKNEESPCQRQRLELISRFSNANIALNGKAIRWQEHTLTLFQLHGIKHCRYAGHRIFIEEGSKRKVLSPRRLDCESPASLFSTRCETQ